MTTMIATTVTHNGVEYQAELVEVKSTFLGREDHGWFTFNLNCEGNSGGFGVGNVGLDAPKNPGHGFERVGKGEGLDLIADVIATTGVESWEKLRGTKILALFAAAAPRGPAVGFANPITGHVCLFSEILSSSS